MVWLDSFKERAEIDGVPIGGFTAYDVDVLVHLYECVVHDRQARQTGTSRQLKAIMGVEVKTRDALPSFDQKQAMWSWHLSMHDVKPDPKLKREYTIRSFGWSFLSLSGTTPDNSERMRWGRFDEIGNIQWRDIPRDILVDVMAFVRHPESWKLQPFHRHHGSRSLYRTEEQPLGFSVPVIDVEKY